MKIFLNKIIPLIIIALLISCAQDNNEIRVSQNTFALTQTSDITSPSVLTPQSSTDVFAILNWDKVDNGISSVSTYSIIISDHDADPNFENVVEYTGDGISVSQDIREVSLKVSEFNDLLNKLPSFKCSEMNIDIRVKSTLGNGGNEFYQYSTPVTFAVTPFSTSKQILAFVKEGDDVKTSPRILSSAFDKNTDFEGYMYLQPGNYKFYQPDACGDFSNATVYGGSANVLSSLNTAPSITIVNEGHYLIKANLSTGVNSYLIREFTTLGIFGRATRTNAFNNQVPMTYDSTTKTWKLTVDLFKGYKFKFKSNLWTGALIVPTPPALPYAPGTANTFVSILGKLSEGKLIENNATNSGDITVPGAIDDTRQKYDIVLDVSKPREYTYSLILNPN